MAIALHVVREFYNEDAIFCDQADERHEADLREDVHSGRPSIGPEWHIWRGHFEEGENEGAEHGEGDGAEEDDERIAEAVELGGEDEENHDDGEGEGEKELRRALGAELAGFASVVEDVASGENLGSFVFEEFQSLVERHDGDAAEFDGIHLLEALEIAGLDFVFDGRDGGEGNEFTLRATDADVEELLLVETPEAGNLRDDLVAAPVHVEAIHKIPTGGGGEVGTDLREVEAESGDLVAVDDELGLRPVVFYADDWREGEFAAGHGLELELLDKFQNALGIGGGRHNDLDGKVAATGQSGWHYGKGTHAGDSAKACLHLVLYVKNSPVALRPAF